MQWESTNVNRTFKSMLGLILVSAALTASGCSNAPNTVSDPGALLKAEAVWALFPHNLAEDRCHQPAANTARYDTAQNATDVQTRLVGRAGKHALQTWDHRLESRESGAPDYTH